MTIGDRLAVPRRVPEPVDTKPMAESEVILLAHMIGDGSCVKKQPIRYASVDEANVAAVTVSAAYFGVTAVRDDYPAARVTTLRLPAPYRLTHGRRNPIAAWLDELGLFGLRSHEKYVPQPVFALPRIKRRFSCAISGRPTDRSVGMQRSARGGSTTRPRAGGWSMMSQPAASRRCVRADQASPQAWIP